MIQEELSIFFQRNAQEICLGAMVTVTVVRISPDLSIARCYLSVFSGGTKEEVLNNIKLNTGKIRGELGKKLKGLRHIPQLVFFVDDSLDYAMEIERLLKK